MPQRPAGISRVQRPQTPPAVPPERPTAPRNGLSWTGRAGWNGYAKGLENHPAANTPAPTGGEGVPSAPADQACPKCWATTDDSAGHAEWHAKLDRWVAGVNRDLAAVQEFLQQRGFLAAGGDSAANDGDSAEGGQ